MSSKTLFILAILLLILSIGCANPSTELVPEGCDNASSAVYYLSREIEQPGIYLTCVGDQPKPVILGEGIQEYTVSAAGNIVYAQKLKPGELKFWLFDQKQNQKNEIQDCKGDRCESLVMSPDGRNLFFSRYGESTGLYQFSLDRSETTLISSSYSDWIDISPSEDYLRFHEPGSGLIRVLSLDDYELLFSFPGDTDLVGSWDTVGQKFIMGERNVNGELLVSEFVEIDVISRSQSRLFSLPLGIEYFRPIYAGDDTYFVLSRTGVRNNSRVIQRIARSGDILQTITNDIAFDHSSLQWNAEDGLLAYQRFDITQSSSSPEILVWDINTGKTLIVARNAVQPQWQD